MCTPSPPSPAPFRRGTQSCVASIHPHPSRLCMNNQPSWENTTPRIIRTAFSTPNLHIKELNTPSRLSSTFPSSILRPTIQRDHRGMYTGEETEFQEIRDFARILTRQWK